MINDENAAWIFKVPVKKMLILQAGNATFSATGRTKRVWIITKNAHLQMQEDFQSTYFSPKA